MLTRASKLGFSVQIRACSESPALSVVIRRFVASPASRCPCVGVVHLYHERNLEHLHNNQPNPVQFWETGVVAYQLCYKLVKFTDALTSVMPPKGSDYCL